MSPQQTMQPFYSVVWLPHYSVSLPNNSKALATLSVFLFADFLLLGWAGQEVVAEPFVLIGQLGTVFYFFYFLILIPSLGIIEHFLINTELN